MKKTGKLFALLVVLAVVVTVGLQGNRAFAAEAVQWTVTYDANGGAGGPGVKSFAAGSAAFVAWGRPTRVGYSFIGWAEDPAAENAEYLAGARLELSGDITLYAVWAAPAQLALDAENPADITRAGDISWFEFIAPRSTVYTFTSTGSLDTKVMIYAADGTLLAEDDDGGAERNFCMSCRVTAGQRYYLAARLYAGTGSYGFRVKEEADDLYVVSYNANGGVGAPGSRKCGSILWVTRQIPTRIPYTFMGWSMDPSAEEADFLPEMEEVLGGDLTLYAVWRAPSQAKYGAENRVNIRAARSKEWFTFTAPSTGTYVLESTGYRDTMLVVYDENGSLLARDDDSGTDRNFRLSMPMTAGTRYYLGASMFGNYYDGFTGSFDFTITPHYTLSYDANGGSGAPAPRTVTYDQKLFVSWTRPTRVGYTFLGWAESPDAAEADYQPGKIFCLSSDLKLYALWGDPIEVPSGSKNSVSITRGGDFEWFAFTAPDSMEYVFESAGSADAWFFLYDSQGDLLALDDDSGTDLNFRMIRELKAGETYLLGARLYAGTGSYTFTIAEACTVGYDANGGTGEPESRKAGRGTEMKLSTTEPTRTGFTFAGWSEGPKGRPTLQPGQSYTPEGSVTLYAVWDKPAFMQAGTETEVVINNPEHQVWFAFTAPRSVEYIFESTGDADAQLALYDSDWNLLAEDDDSGAGVNFRLAYGLTSGNRYNVCARMYRNRTGSYTFTVVPKPERADYTLMVHTYSFPNFKDSDSSIGHCFGMSSTSGGYYTGVLSKSIIGGGAGDPLYGFDASEAVTAPICHYQKIQGSYSNRAIVAGGSTYLMGFGTIAMDWQAVVKFVSDHYYDNTGLLQIGYRSEGEGGHAVNFLRYENVDGEDRLYAYDNTFPNQEVYFYMDGAGCVREAPVRTFSGALSTIALRNVKVYFAAAGGYDSSRALYLREGEATVEGYGFYRMETGMAGAECLMYEFPAGEDCVIIDPIVDNASFTYMGTEYRFGRIKDDTYGELQLVNTQEGIAALSEPIFIIHNAASAFGEAEFTLPEGFTQVGDSAFEQIAARSVYLPDSCVSIGEYAFRNSAVEKIRIGADCTIADSAFEGCGNIEIYSTPGSYAERYCLNHSNCTFIEE